MTTEDAKTTSVVDDVRAAMGELDTAAPIQETPTPPVEGTDEPISNRDELGRFKGGEKAKAEPTKTEEAPPVEDKKATAQADATKTLAEGVEAAGKWDPNRAPSTWKPALREKWNTLPEEIRQEITRREEASVLGVAKIHEQYAPVKELAGALDTFIQEARQYGVAPAAHIASTMQTERVLRTAAMPQKFQALLQIADTYKIPLREVINESVGANVLQNTNQQATVIPPEIARELQEMRNWRESLDTQKIDNDIVAFSSDPKNEFFADVKDTMADLIEAGKAKDLAGAYELAIWMNPEVRDVMITRRAAPPTDTVAKRQLTAAGAGVKSKAKVDVAPSDDDDDIRTTVAKAVAATAGRK